jgi:hypothetical protein
MEADPRTRTMPRRSAGSSRFNVVPPPPATDQHHPSYSSYARLHREFDTESLHCWEVQSPDPAERICTRANRCERRISRTFCTGSVCPRPRRLFSARWSRFEPDGDVFGPVANRGTDFQKSRALPVNSPPPYRSERKPSHPGYFAFGDQRLDLNVCTALLVACLGRVHNPYVRNFA